MPKLLETIYRDKLALLTDLYELTMAYGYWQQRMHDREAVFNLFFRKNPFGGNFAIACGLEIVIEYLQRFQFSVHDIQYLAGLKGADGQPLFDESFLNYLQRLQFTCSVHAMPEGTLAFPNEPLLRIQGPLLQAQILETVLLTIVNFSTLIATKAARVMQAAEGDSVLEFGLRRAQGFDGGLTASRSAFIGGCEATSNTLAGRVFGIPVKGTHAHSWVMSFDSELEAFENYAQAMPGNSIFLVDTYDTVEGVRNAIKVGKELEKKGFKFGGIRLDSGDLAELSKIARQMLDEAGFETSSIVASNDLDEYEIQQLKAKGAKINVWGVGTKLVTAYDQPALGGVYKLAAIRDKQGEWQYKVKLSEQAIKTSNPGIQQVRRFFQEGKPIGDVILDERLSDTTNFALHPFSNSSGKLQYFDFNEGQNLLQPIFENGQLVYESPSLRAIQQRTLEQLTLFSSVDFKNYPLGLERHLYEKKLELM